MYPAPCILHQMRARTSGKLLVIAIAPAQFLPFALIAIADLLGWVSLQHLTDKLSKAGLPSLQITEPMLCFECKRFLESLPVHHRVRRSSKDTN